MHKIPFNRPRLVGDELDLIGEAIDNMHLSGDGPFAHRCSEWLQSTQGCAGALITHSCTGALEMAAILAEIEPGDEVVMPSFTFPSTANAFVLRGATPVFVDIRDDTFNIDESLIEDAITERTRAIVPVHYAGVGCEMDAIGEIAAGCGAMVIEDAAEGLGATWGDKPLGSFGQLAALSFHETKNVICGEGGALLINAPELVERAEILYEKGTDRIAFHRGESDRYTWVDIGSSFLASDLTAAFLWAQLQHTREITAARLAIWRRYHSALADLEADDLLQRPAVGETQHNAHCYYVLLEDRARRDELIAGLEKKGIGAVFHYIPLHSSPAGRRFGRATGEMKVTDETSDRLVRLPLWVGIDDAVDTVVEAVEAELRT